jgi:hypothetical protein
MAGFFQRQLRALYGSTRFGAADPTRITAETGFVPSGDDQKENTPWLTGVRKLVPGEALAGYVSLSALSETSKHPERVSVIIAIIFLFVAMTSRWLGSQDPDVAKPSQTAQPAVVLLSGLSFVSLVYATGGQIYWHPTVEDQKLYGQIASAAIGIVGPLICDRFARQPAD